MKSGTPSPNSFLGHPRASIFQTYKQNTRVL
jgi:hypothetical protein